MLYRPNIMKGLFWISVTILVGNPLYSEGNDEVSSNKNQRNRLTKQAVAAYKSACQKLQDLADWMSVVLKVKSLFSRSISRKTQSRLMPMPTELKEPDLPKSLNKDTREQFSCASLRNLHLSAQTYVQWQAQLVTAKTMVSGNVLRSNFAKLNESIDGLKNVRNQVKQLSIVNRTSTLLLESLKLGGQGLSLQVDGERNQTLNLIRNIGKAPDFLQYLNVAKETLQEHLQNLFEASENLKKAQNFLQMGDLLQNFGSILDRKLLQISPTTNAKEFSTESEA